MNNASCWRACSSRRSTISWALAWHRYPEAARTLIAAVAAITSAKIRPGMLPQASKTANKCNMSAVAAITTIAARSAGITRTTGHTWSTTAAMPAISTICAVSVDSHTVNLAIAL